MVDLIEDLMKTETQPPAYRRIQDFIAKVYIPTLVLSFHTLKSRIRFHFIQYVCIFFSQVGAGRTRPNTKPKLHPGIDSSLPMCPKTCVCRTSRPHHHIFLSGTSGLLILRFCLPLLMPTSMTMVSSCLHMPLILRSLDQFTIGHTLRNSMLPKIDLA